MLPFLHAHTALQAVALSVRSAEVKVMSGECVVLDGLFAMLMQGLLFLVTVACLVIKWSQETPRRKFAIFVMDGSKQILGAGVMHCWNLVCAIYLDDVVDYGDQCTWYWLNIVVDTTFGCIVAYVFLQISMKIWNYDSGHYMLPDGTLDKGKWVVQVGHWCIIISFMKIVCVIVIYVGGRHLHAVAEFFLQNVKDSNKAKLLVVMIITPAVMNTFQFYVTDTFIKWKGEGQHETDEKDKGSKDGLLREEAEGSTA